MGATAGFALSAVSTVTNFTSQRRAASAAEAQGRYAADIYGLNASVAEQQAADAIARGQEAETRSRQSTRQLAGHQRAALAANGVDVGVGSSVDIQADTAALGELDALTIRNNARREAWGFQMEAQNDRMQGQLARMGGENAAAELRSRSWSTLLTGGLDTWNYAGDAKRAIGKRNRLGPKSRAGWGGSA